MGPRGNETFIGNLTGYGYYTPPSPYDPSINKQVTLLQKITARYPALSSWKLGRCRKLLIKFQPSLKEVDCYLTALCELGVDTLLYENLPAGLYGLGANAEFFSAFIRLLVDSPDPQVPPLAHLFLRRRIEAWNVPEYHYHIAPSKEKVLYFTNLILDFSAIDLIQTILSRLLNPNSRVGLDSKQLGNMVEPLFEEMKAEIRERGEGELLDKPPLSTFGGDILTKRMDLFVPVVKNFHPEGSSDWYIPNYSSHYCTVPTTKKSEGWNLLLALSKSSSPSLLYKFFQKILIPATAAQYYEPALKYFRNDVRSY